MKLRTILCTLALFSLSHWLDADQGQILPTEISDPPYAVGQLPSTQGYYIKRPEQTSINYRIVENKIRVYWIDENGLIAEPELTLGNVRFKGLSKKRNFFALDLLPSGAGLGSEGIVKPPHVFNVALYLGSESGETSESYSFRYLAAMDFADDEEVVKSTVN